VTLTKTALRTIDLKSHISEAHLAPNSNKSATSFFYSSDTQKGSSSKCTTLPSTRPVLQLPAERWLSFA